MEGRLCFATMCSMWCVTRLCSWRSRQDSQRLRARLRTSSREPASTAMRVQLSLSLELKDRDEVSGVDERLIFCPLVICKHSFVSSFGKNIDPRLKRRIYTEIGDTLR